MDSLDLHGPDFLSPAADQLSKSHVRSSHSQTEEEAPVRPDPFRTDLLADNRQTVVQGIYFFGQPSVFPPN